METGKKAVVIIIIAIMLTAGIGFFFNFDKQTVDKTEYSPIGNVDALISANSSRTQESELYNSVYNVTGWTPNSGIVRLPANQTNTYILTEAYETYTSANYNYNIPTHGYTTRVSTQYNMSGSTPSVDNIDNYNGFITSKTGYRYYPQNYDTLCLGTGPNTVSEDYSVIGGYGQKEIARYLKVTAFDSWHVYRTTELKYQFAYNGTTTDYTYSDGNYLVFVPLSSVIDMNSIITDETRNDKFEIRVNSSGYSYYDGTLTAEFSKGNVVTDPTDSDREIRNDTLSVKLSANNMWTFDYLRYNEPTGNWNAYNTNNQRIGTINPDTFYIVSTSTSQSQISLSLRHYTFVPATYADPTKYVEVGGTMVWSNYDKNNSFVNTEISILLKGQGAIMLGKSDNTYSATPITVSITNDKYIVNGTEIGKYIGIRLTISPSTGNITVRGILTDNSNPGEANTPTYTYTVSDLAYTVAYNYESDTIYRLQFVPTNNMKAYIDSTYILTDPNQVLWKDIHFNLADYFPGTTANKRLLFEGFVRYGDSVQINALTFPVTDNTVVINGVTFNLNGMAIDFQNNHTYVVQTNGRASVDLGVTQTTQINMAGVWYFSALVSEIYVYSSEESVWTPNWMMDVNTTVLTFIGVIFASLIVMALRFREELELIDVIILILTMIIAMSLLVIT